MANILLPTDLSDNALHACAYVIRLFGAQDHAYTLVYAYMDPNVGNSVWPAAGADMYQASVEALGEWAKRLLALPGVAGAALGIEVLYGPLSPVLNELASEKGADLVAMGTQGASGSTFLGSNAGEVLRRSDVPVLVVPARSGDRPVKRILFADDALGVEPSTLGVLLSIAKRTGSEVVLAHVVREADELPDEKVVAGYDELLADVPHRFVSEEGTDIAGVIDFLADREEADMVAVLHRHSGFFEGFFHKSTAKRLALYTHIPLLVLQQLDPEA